MTEKQMGLFSTGDVEKKGAKPKKTLTRSAKEAEALALAMKENELAVKESEQSVPVDAGAASQVQPEHSDVLSDTSAVPRIPVQIPVRSPVVPITKAEKWNTLVTKAEEWGKYMEACHLQEYDSKWAKEYTESVENLQAVYVLLVPLDRENVEGFRLKVRKEIVKVEREMAALYDRIAVTKGNKLDEQAETISLRHLRLLDQFEALSYALKVNGGYGSRERSGIR